MNNKIFITGGTGYIGSRIIQELLRNNFEIKALVRKGSESRLPGNCIPVLGNALKNSTYKDQISPCETFIHLIGVPHPGPWKKKQFNSIDLVSVQQAVPAALNAGIKQFIYLSVAHPAPIMKDYIEVRMKGEKLIKESGMNASFVRPWYVLGPGHYWPVIMLPFYKIFEKIPSTKEFAYRLGYVKIDQIINCILYSVKNPSEGIKIYDVNEIKKF